MSENTTSTKPADTAAAPPPGGRDEKGRFAPGNFGGPGNPYARQVAGLRRALLAMMTTQKFQAVAEKLFAMACEGDLAAIKLLLEYTIGKPTPAVDPDRLDIEEWASMKETMDQRNEFQVLASAGSLDYLVKMARIGRDSITLLEDHHVKEYIKMTPEQRAQAAAAKDAADLEKIYKTQASPVYQPLKVDPPSPNGIFESSPPSPNGIFETRPPSPNGIFETSPPSPNGVFETGRPSPNGVLETGRPSPNGKKPPEKAPAKAPPPVDPLANGRNHHLPVG